MDSTDTTSQEWTRMRFKRHKVWVALDTCGNIRIDKGKALIKYQQDQNYEYQVHSSDIRPLDDTAQSAPSRNVHKRDRMTVSAPDITMDEDCIHIFTDGASSGNPGPSGIGVLMRYREHEKEISRYIGMGTNNIAELEAIRAGLLEAKRYDIPVRIYTDSSYAHGLLSLGWKARKNIELVHEIQMLIKRFKNVKLIKVKGHCGIEENEKADKLATSAIQTALKKTS